MYLSVIIPAYNEEKRIGKTLESIRAYLANQNFEYEVIVVNNRSKDRTAEVVESFREKIPNLKLINENHAGKGYAVKKGMFEAKSDYRLFMDADNATTIDHVEKMLPYFREGYDVVIGSLTVPGSKIVRGEPFWRVILGKLGNKWIQIFAVWGINDTQRGFKVFSTEAAEKIFPQVTIFGWGFDIEVLALAKRYGYKIKEVPITWNNDPSSKVSIWAYPQVLLQTLKVFWNLRTGIYA